MDASSEDVLRAKTYALLASLLASPPTEEVFAQWQAQLKAMERTDPQMAQIVRQQLGDVVNESSKRYSAQSWFDRDSDAARAGGYGSRGVLGGIAELFLGIPDAFVGTQFTRQSDAIQARRQARLLLGDSQ